MRLGTPLARAILAAGIVSGLLASPALAMPPDREPALSDPFASEDCGFEVDVMFPKQHETATTFYDQAGNVRKIHISGQLHIQFTNPANGRTVVVSASGRLVIDFVKGRSLALGTGAGPSPLGGIIVGHGQFGLDGVPIHGTSRNLCPLLA